MKLMKRITACLVPAAAALAFAVVQGTAPRDTPDKYDSHAELNGVTIGATLLTPGQMHKALTTDVGRCCRVVEVALYPSKDGSVEVSLSDFTLRAGEDGAKPSTPKVAALRSSQDRDRLRPTLILAMEQELGERALPTGSANAPVSGYLYFSMPSNKKSAYQLEYTFKGNKAVLPLR